VGGIQFSVVFVVRQRVRPFFFFQAEDGIRDKLVTGVQTCALPISGRDWLRTFRGYVHDMVEAVRREAAAGATLDEVKQRVTTALAPTYEKAFSAYGEYRPWRAGLAGNVERTFAMVS